MGRGNRPSINITKLLPYGADMYLMSRKKSLFCNKIRNVSIFQSFASFLISLMTVTNYKGVFDYARTRAYTGTSNAYSPSLFEMYKRNSLYFPPFSVPGYQYTQASSWWSTVASKYCCWAKLGFGENYPRNVKFITCTFI